MQNFPRVVRFFLVRHGQVEANKNFSYVGRLDQPLTETGRRQAQKLGEAMRPLGVNRVLSSPLERTFATGTAIAKACGLENEPEEGLIEQSFGDWEGLTRDQVKELGEVHRSTLEQFDRDSTVTPPGGEALVQLQRRAVQVVADLRDQHVGDSIVLVSHVGPIKALIAAGMGLTLEQVRPFFLDPGTITVIDWGERAWLRLFNAHAHMGWEHAKWMKR